MRIAVVILNWNTMDYLRQFVPGVLASLGGEDGLFVADSGSADGSLEMLAAEFPQVRRIPLGENLGFAGGYNKALQGIDAQYYLLLNSDIEVDRNWIEPLADWMETHPGCGVCAPKLLALDKSESGWTRTGRFEYAGAAGGYVDRFGYPYCRGRVLSQVENDEGQYDTPQQVFWVSGAAFMIRKEVWDKAGGFDARFFAHMEEIDLCWRVQNLGWSVYVVPESTVYHIGGGTLPKESPFKLKLNYRNSLWMLRKNLPYAIGRSRANCRIAFRYILDWASAFVYLASGKPSFAKAVIQAHKEAGRRRTEPVNSGAKIPLMPVNLLLQKALRGKKIFNYLRRYESSH